MILKFSALCLVLLLSAACSGSDEDPDSCKSGSNNVPVFGDAQVPTTATHLGAADASTNLTVVLGLRRDQSRLTCDFQRIATPGSKVYQQYTDVATIADKYGASPDTKQVVTGYLQARGVSVTADATGAFVYGDATVSTWSGIFGTAFGSFRVTLPDNSTSTFIAPSGTPVLPGELHNHVTEVVGLSTESFVLRGIYSDAPAVPSAPQPSNGSGAIGTNIRTGTTSGCANGVNTGGVTPNQWRTAYGLDTLQAAGYQGQGVSVALVEESSFSQTNLDDFTQCFSITNATTPTVTTVKGSAPALGGEAHLDVEIMLAAAPRLSGMYVLQMNVTTPADFVILFASPLNTHLTGGSRVHIISSSIALCELAWTATAINLMEHILLTAATARISVFNSAGDSGSSGCRKDNQFVTAQTVTYPPSSGYVTAVGGTNLALNTANQITGQGVWNGKLFDTASTAGGGGGYSRFLQMPFWQTGTDVPVGNRITPDIALFADPSPGYAIRTHNGWIADGGTSAAAPLAAGAVALLQQKAVAQNVVLDPAFLWIYRLANGDNYQSAFTDVVRTNNDIADLDCCNAGSRFDAASGWGSPKFDAIASLLLP